MTEFLASQIPRDPDQLVVYTRVLLQEIGQGFGILLLFGQIVDGNLGTLPGNGDCSMGGQLSSIEEQESYSRWEWEWNGIRLWPTSQAAR